MQLKRKHSDVGMNSPLRFTPSSSPYTNVSMDTDNFKFVANLSTPSQFNFDNKTQQLPHASGRTLKRVRDNRPSEQEIHQHTLDMLYSAQRQQTQPQDAHPTYEKQNHNPETEQSSSSQQTDLHNFWNIPSRPSAPPASTLPTNIDTPTECEDCGQKFANADGDSMMDVDGDVSDIEGVSCVACGKHVCSHCSITNLGEQPRCLGCAGTTATRTENSAKEKVPWATGMSNWLC